MGTLLQSVQTAYSNWRSSKDVTLMNESELTEYNMTVIKFEKAITDATAVEAAFYEAKAEAFAAFNATKEGEYAALATLWQGYEDNDMTVA